MTNTDPADTRPRCQVCLDRDDVYCTSGYMIHHIMVPLHTCDRGDSMAAHHEFVRLPDDWVDWRDKMAKPAPTPSGDEAIQATICLDCGHGHPSSGERGCSVTRADHQRCGCTYYRPQRVADREAAIRAESAAALEEARARAERLDFALGAADLDIRGWFQRAEEAAVRAERAEAEVVTLRDEIKRLRAHLAYFGTHQRGCLWTISAGKRDCTCGYADAIRAAASRPVLPAPSEECRHKTETMRDGLTYCADCGARLLDPWDADKGQPASSPVAAPSEEVRE